MLSFYSWLHCAGVRRDPMFRGLVWRVSASEQRRIMSEIHKQIIPSRGVRVTTDEIPGFPEVDIQCILCDLDDVEKINKNYEEIQSALATLRARATDDKNPDSAITRTLRARQQIELFKIPAAIEIARDRLECGYSIGIFCNFRATVEELSRQLRCDFVDGSVTGGKRDEIIADFQANKTRAIVLNSEACGICIGLQDLDGEHPRIGLIFPGYSATVLTQVLGRFRRDGGKSKCHYRILLAANTIEMRIKAILDLKMGNLDALLDSDLIP